MVNSDASPVAEESCDSPLTRTTSGVRNRTSSTFDWTLRPGLSLKSRRVHLGDSRLAAGLVAFGIDDRGVVDGTARPGPRHSRSNTTWRTPRPRRRSPFPRGSARASLAAPRAEPGPDSPRTGCCGCGLPGSHDQAGTQPRPTSPIKANVVLIGWSRRMPGFLSPSNGTGRAEDRWEYADNFPWKARRPSRVGPGSFTPSPTPALCFPTSRTRNGS